MSPVLLHFGLIGGVMLLAFISRKHCHRSMAEERSRALIIEYGQTSRTVTIIFSVLMGGLIFFATLMTGVLSVQDWVAVSSISVGYAIALLVVLDRRLVLTEDWVSSGMSLLRPKRIPLSALRGAQVASTEFFGGVTTIKTEVGHIKIWHQMADHEIVLSRLLSSRTSLLK